MMRYSIGNPMPGHYPRVGRTFLGTTWGGGRTYGTTLSCGCGWSAGKITNIAPSAGGKIYAQERYREHVEEMMNDA